MLRLTSTQSSLRKTLIRYAIVYFKKFLDVQLTSTGRSTLATLFAILAVCRDATMTTKSAEGLISFHRSSRHTSATGTMPNLPRAEDSKSHCRQAVLISRNAIKETLAFNNNRFRISNLDRTVVAS